MRPITKPSTGRIVLYRTHGGYDAAALITATESPEDWPPLAEGHVHLTIFQPPFGVPEYIEREKGVPYSACLDPGTWRWPERV